MNRGNSGAKSQKVVEDLDLGKYDKPRYGSGKIMPLEMIDLIEKPFASFKFPPREATDLEKLVVKEIEAGLIIVRKFPDFTKKIFTEQEYNNKLEKWEQFATSELMISLERDESTSKVKVHHEIINSLWLANQRREEKDKNWVKNLLEKVHGTYLNKSKKTIHFLFKGKEEADEFLGKIIFTKYHKYVLMKPNDISKNSSYPFDDLIESLKEIF